MSMWKWYLSQQNLRILLLKEDWKEENKKNKKHSSLKLFLFNFENEESSFSVLSSHIAATYPGCIFNASPYQVAFLRPPLLLLCLWHFPFPGPNSDGLPSLAAFSTLPFPWLRFRLVPFPCCVSYAFFSLAATNFSAITRAGLVNINYS